MRLPPRFFVLLLSFGLLFWGGTLVLSATLIAPQKKEHVGPQVDVSKLRAQVEENPSDQNVRLQFASALASKAQADGDMSLLLESLEQYTAVLEQDPENLAALSALGDLSFASGVLDKAVAYYERYLSKKPDDVKVQTDHALVLLQSGQHDKAVGLLEQVVAKNEKIFPARLSLALAYKVAGQTDKARQQAAIASDLAPDAGGKEVVRNFVKGVSDGGSDGEAASDTQAPVQEPAVESGLQSPAATVEAYFRKHPIVGPKVARITWADATTARVEVREFPVEAMPPFAREKVVSGVASQISGFSPPITVQLIDAESGRVLLTVPEAKAQGPQ